MTATSLTNRLAGWPDHRLHRLLLLRPDLCHPPVPDFAALAARACTRMSVVRVLDGLDRAHLDVLEALAVLAQLADRTPARSPGDEPAPAGPDAGRSISRRHLASFLRAPAPDDAGSGDPQAVLADEDASRSGGHATPAALDAILTDLADAALVLAVADGWQLPLAVATALGRHPLGFGRSLTVLRTDDTLDSFGSLDFLDSLDSLEVHPAGGTHLTAATGPASPGVPTISPTGTPSRGEAPGRLGDPGQVPADRAGVLALLGRHTVDPDLLARAAAALDALQSSPVARVPDPAGPVHEVLLNSGLLVRTGRLPDGTTLAEHPLEAGLAWRDGTSGRTVDTAPPAPTDRTVPTALCVNAALAAVADLLRGCADVLAALEGGLPTLRSGGVGVRELRRLADAGGSTPRDTSWLLELLAAAGLVVLDPDTSRWTVAAQAADWRRSARHLQWRALVLGWLGSGRAPMLGPVPVTGGQPAGSSPTTDAQALQASAASTGTAAVPATRASRSTPPGAVPSPAAGGRALAPDRNRPDAPRLRSAVLQTARELAGERPGVRLDEAVPRRQSWCSPRHSARTAPFTAPLLAEAARLGLTGAGALTDAGSLVAEGRFEDAADAVGRALPAPVTRVRLQGDLTAVAPGYLDPGVARQLAVMADAEGDGAARVYRFSDDSLHRALDSGLDAGAIEQFLSAHSEDSLPQSLRYLIRDVARRHGSLAIGAAGSWLRVQDEALLDVIVADQAMTGAGLERVAPTVAVAAVGQGELHRMLAAAGHRAALLGPAPGGTAAGHGGAAAGHTTGPDGGTATGVGTEPRHRPEPRAATADPVFPDPVRAVRWRPSEAELAAQVDRLRAAPRSAPTGAGTEEAVALLRHAARHRAPVRLTTVDRRGDRSEQRVVPLAVAGGRVRALVPEREAETVIPLHRIVSAEPAGRQGNP